jgi:hypothetical protein
MLAGRPSLGASSGGHRGPPYLSYLQVISGTLLYQEENRNSAGVARRQGAGFKPTLI